MINGRSMLRLVTFAALLVAAALPYAQESVMVKCENGYCIIKESDLDHVQQVIYALLEKIEELKGKTGCS